MRDPRYDILFEPVKIGPVTARNRFFQVPHCNGMGYRDPTALATMRGIKAEGGWAVVCTEQVEFHYSSDITPFIELRLWDDRDVPMLARMVDKIHEHGSLAGIELAYNGMNGPNLYGREVPMGPAHLPVATFTYEPVQARRMDKTDIANLRRWHRQAAIRAKTAGFDLIYVYAAHALGFLHHFLSRRYNDRTDEYGGSLENRIRLMREITQDTKEAVGATCAVPLRISLDELMGEGGLYKEEVEDMIGLMAELPDLWDVTIAGWENDSRTSRFAEEGHEEPFIKDVKRLTTKPVVGVGRYTSPDAMVRIVKSGLVDLIGAARPSIADPFLPKKVEEGRLDDIRECIGCNICVSGDFSSAPIRCTQNPTMGDEWRRGWHPERIRARESESRVLIVGGGPAGLECAQALGKRGYGVVIAEAGTSLGGRVTREAKLPGLAVWGRVRDWRLQQLHQLPNVETYFDSRLTADDVLGFGFEHVVVATGARWRGDGVGHQHTRPVTFQAPILTPDDLMEGKRPTGRTVVVWDDDHYYMGSVLAELLAAEGYGVTYVTPAAEVATWTRATMEQHFIQRRLIEAGIAIRTGQTLTAAANSEAQFACIYTGRPSMLPCDAIIPVTGRLPNETLFLALEGHRADWRDAGILSVTAIGDARAPATIAHAVHAGRRYAEELDAPPITGDTVPFKREIAGLEAW
jgi:dimethylamine/trimethylamine dehydrogenase